MINTETPVLQRRIKKELDNGKTFRDLMDVITHAKLGCPSDRNNKYSNKNKEELHREVQKRTGYTKEEQQAILIGAILELKDKLDKAEIEHRVRPPSKGVYKNPRNKPLSELDDLPRI